LNKDTQQKSAIAICNIAMDHSHDSLPAPLDKRTTTSRRQRRALRNQENEVAIVASPAPAPAPVLPSAPPSAPPAAPLPKSTTNSIIESKRRPSRDVEDRIASSIAKRTQSNAAAAVNEALHYNSYSPSRNNSSSNGGSNSSKQQEFQQQQRDPHDDETEILGTYEYLDHTADIQLHSWGKSLSEALEMLVMAMFGYMTTKLSLVDTNEQDSIAYGSRVRVQAHDVESLVFQFLQEWLEIFHESKFVPRHVRVEWIDIEKDFVVISSGYGETMKPEKHLQGTEVKAVTYSNLQVMQDLSSDESSSGRWDIWVIVDI